MAGVKILFLPVFRGEKRYDRGESHWYVLSSEKPETETAASAALYKTRSRRKIVQEGVVFYEFHPSFTNRPFLTSRVVQAILTRCAQHEEESAGRENGEPDYHLDRARAILVDALGKKRADHTAIV